MENSDTDSAKQISNFRFVSGADGLPLPSTLRVGDLIASLDGVWYKITTIDAHSGDELRITVVVANP